MYTPIHVHSMYSIRDSIIKIEDLAKRCKDLGIESCAITDHGFLGASYKQYKAFKEVGIKPLFGCEFYFTDNAESKEKHFHVLLIAKNAIGLQNLNTLNRYSYVTGFYKKPRIDWEAISKYKEGLICTTACVFGLPQQQFLNNQLDEAIVTINKFKKIFGEDFYLEIADHQMEDETKVRDFFRNTGNDLNIKVVPATDAHYLLHTDKPLHNLFKQLAYNSLGKAETEDGFPGTGYHIWTIDEMKASFSPEELITSLEIAEKCNNKFEFTKYHLPKYKIETKEDPHEILRRLTYEGLNKKGLKGNKIYEDKVEFELLQLHLADLEDYFLIVWDYVLWCKKNDIPVGPGRGSAAGSLVSYLLGITGVDPIKYDLMFTRAINPGRALQYDFGV